MGNYTQLYIHLVWATRFRQPLLTPVARDIAFRTFRAECRSLGATLIAAGGVEDHVHLLVRIPTTVPIMTLVKQLKGVSSRRITLETGAPFRWQGGYGVFTVRKSGVDQVRGYILGQERRHATHR
jgi:REP element-mobilizing transposase RayT